MPQLSLVPLFICKTGVEKKTSIRPDVSFFILDTQAASLDTLSAREVMETCVISTLLYGAENWILDEACLLERFQAEIGRRILRLNRYHSYLAVRIGLSLPSIASRILIQKLGYLLCLSSSKDVSIATNTFKMIACLNAYTISRSSKLTAQLRY